MKNISTLQVLSIYAILFVGFGILANWYTFFKYAFFIVFALGVAYALFMIIVGIIGMINDLFGK